MADLRALRRLPLGALYGVALLAASAGLSTAVVGQEASSWPAAPKSAPQQQQVGPAPAESLAAASPADSVVDVKVRGNKSLPLSKILPHIRTRPGRPFDLELIEEDVRRLDHTHLFVNVQTYWQKVPGGRIVFFDLVERPLLRDVLFVGCKEVRKKTLQKEADLKKGDPVDPYAIEEARRKLEEFYHKKGFTTARVTLLEGDKVEDRRAVFLINEGVKQKVWQTAFVGNIIADDDRLRTQISTSRPFLWMFGGEFDRKKLDEDVEKLTAYYRGLGYFRARISRELDFNEKQNWVTITYIIDEGPRYKVREVSVVGNTKYTSEQLLTDRKLQSGDYFNQGKMAADLSAMQDKYGGIGYVFADVKADPRFLEEPAQLDLVFNIKEGDRYRVGKINVHIKGEYPHTQITTILNRLSFKPGDIVDIREIRQSERRIRASQLFESNMASGNAPKIVFSPPGQEGQNPEEDDKTEVADRRKPESKPGHGAGRGTGGGAGRGAGGGMGRGMGGGMGESNGQSDDAPTFRGQSPETASADRELDLTLDCGRYIGPKEASDQQLAPGEQHLAPGEYTGGQHDAHTSGQCSAAGNVAPPCIHGGLSDRVRTDDLLAQAQDLTNSLAQTRRPQQSRERLILTQQYTPDPNQPNAAPYGQPQNQQPDVQNQQAAPVQPGPAYGQSTLPRQGSGPERQAPSPQGPYQPGPIFAEGSPFRDGPPGGGDFARPLPFGVSAEETMTGRLMFGVGVNSDAGLVGSIVYDEQNFDWTRFPNSWEEIRNATAWRGNGQRLRIEAAPGTQVSRYMISFMDPYLFNSRVSLGLSGYYYTRYYTEYAEQQLGGRVALGYQFSPDLSGTIAYRGAKINLSDPIDPDTPTGQINNGQDMTLGDLCDRDLALHGFQLTLTHDKRDNAFMATEGHLIEGSIEQVLGSFQYPRAQIDLRKYFTLYERPDGSGRQVLSLAAHGGYTGDDTPIYERFYAGGFSTIRGFQFRGASPTAIGPNINNNVFIGGNFEVLASAEYMFPITADDMLRAVVFCDTGTVEPTINNWSNKYRVAPGFGLRICVPAMGPAPIALDFAFPIAWQPGDKSELFSFFMGFGR